jgi:serine/threonine protein kinase
MAVSTVDEYLSALEKSKLLAGEQLVEAQRLAGKSSDPTDLAKALARENLVSRWQASTLLALGPRAQLRLGKYKLIQRLGKGGMGTVFLAEHVTMNRRVALKIVPRAIAEDRASLDRFFAEARAIAALDHPNIVQAYSVDNEMDRYFIVMEFVDGQDLQQMVETNGPLDFERAAEYIHQAAEGLAHAHARNLVHCDIKPSNLLVNNQGVVKILDLGLARLNQSDDPAGAAASGPAFGTVDYMAPEQALEAANFDHRADIYSLGCTLYCLLTGHPPFPEGSIAQRLAKHQTQEPRDILLERPDTPPKLVEICKRMMAKEPENRYQSIQEVSAALGPRPSGSNGAVRPPKPVKLLEEAVSVNGADDWLSTLTSSTPNGTSSSVKRSVATALSGKSEKRQKNKDSSVGGMPGALAGIRTTLAWFNTRPRIIAGAVGGIASLAALAALAALPFLFANPAPPQTAARSAAAEKKGLLADAGSQSKNSVDKMLDLSRQLRDKNAPNWSAQAPEQPRHPANNSQGKPPKSPGPASQPDKAGGPVATKPEVKPPDPKPKPAEPKPLEPKLVEQPQPPSKPVSFDGLAAAVDLPLLGKAGKSGVSLGKLDLDPKQEVDAKLLGGDIVAKGNPKFDLQKVDAGATGHWSIQMVEKGRDAATIARVWQDQGECKFQWTAEAKDKASLLRFCGLKFSAGNKTHFVALCAQKMVPPLRIDVETGTARARLSRDFILPDASVLRLQVQHLDNSMPKHEIKILDAKARAGRTRAKPAEPVAGDTGRVRDHVIVVLAKDKAPHVSFSISFEVRNKDIMLDMTSSCEISNHTVAFKLDNLREAAAEIAAGLMLGEASQKRGNKAAAESIQAAKMVQEQVKSLGDLAGELEQKASIPFCVYSVLGETTEKVVIFQSGQIENPKAAGAKKNSKGGKTKGHAAPEGEELKLE